VIGHASAEVVAELSGPRRTQKSRCAHRRKGRQQHSVLVAVFVHAQRLAQAGESGWRRPLIPVNATSSPERKCRHRSGIG
jgi:hypothetical protein